MSQLTTVLVPDIGYFDSVDVADVLVVVGELVARDDPLVILEVDKTTMDVPSPAAGRVAEILVAVGQSVARGDAVLELEVEGEAESLAGFE